MQTLILYFSKFFSSKLSNERGLTVAEVTAAIVIVAVTIYVSTGFMNQQRAVTKRISESNACTAYISHMKNKLETMGSRLVVNTPPPLGQVLDMGSGAATAPMTGASMAADGIPDANRWPNTLLYNLIEYDGTYGNPITIRTPHYYNGAMTALLAIYNSGGGHCTASQPFPGAFFTNGAQFGMTNLNASIQIQPVDLDANPGTVVSPCPTNLIIKPKGHPGSATQRTAGTSANLVMSSAAANVRDDLGLLVTIQATYNDQRGGQSTCVGQMNVRYPPDIVPPTPPAGTYNAQNTSVPQIINAVDTGNNPITVTGNPVRVEVGGGCVGGVPQDNVGSADFTINYDSSLVEPGSVLVCRDQSRTLSTASDIQCRNSGGTNVSMKPVALTPQSRQNYTDWSTPPEAGSNPSTVFGNSGGSAKLMDDTQYLDTATTIAFQNSANWVPCGQVQACRQNPTTSTWTAAGNIVTLNLRYNNMAEGCNAKIEYAWVDPAGNISDVREVNHIVKVAECGNLCFGTPSYYYYQCGGCP